MLMNSGIETYGKDIDVKYGLFDYGPERDVARSSLGYIHRDMYDIKKSYFRLGFHLNEFKEFEYYKDFGYENFEEFCENNFDLDKSAISRCINVFLMITDAGNTKYSNGVEIHGCAMDISEKYKSYSYSQLCEMLPLDDKQRDQVKPDMTIKQIREMKNQISDISKTQLMKFFEYFKKEVTHFTREELLKVWNKKAETWSGHHSDEVSYSFKPGKVQIHFSNYYSFAKIIKYYEDCGGTFEEEIATSQQFEEEINGTQFFAGEQFDSEEFLEVMFAKFKEQLENISLDVCDFSRSGKRLNFEDLAGNKYMIQFSVSKKKEG